MVMYQLTSSTENPVHATCDLYARPQEEAKHILRLLMIMRIRRNKFQINL